MIEAIIGGLLIGCAAACLLWGIGRVAGISGIFWQSLQPVSKDPTEQSWRALFILGLVLGPLVLLLLEWHDPPPPSDAGWGTLMVAGLLVGFGTRLGSGCTSGHGICGIARFSGRSVFATLTFMVTGIVTVSLTRHFFL